MADKGFPIEKEIEAVGLKLNFPPFAQSAAEIKPSDVSKTVKNSQTSCAC